MSIRIDVHLCIHPADEATLSRIEAMMATNAEIQQQILQGIADTKAEVTAEKTVVDSAKALLEGLAARLADLINQGQQGTLDPSQILTALGDLKTAVDTNKDELTAAVVANTPSA